MKMKKGAVIGIGGIGNWHGQMMRDTKRIQVVAVCDANEGLAAKAKENFPDARFYTAVAPMLAETRPDLVTIAVPHNLHAPVAIQCLKAGANVIVEKPMATQYTDCVAMIKTAKQNRRFVTVFHNRRLDGWFLAAQSVIRDGLLGNLFEINLGINYPQAATTWRGYKESSGGVIYDWGAHLVDYALHFANSPVKTVSGFIWRSPRKDPRLNEDHAAIRIHFQSGAVANIRQSAVDCSSPHRHHLVGDKGTLIDDWNWDEKAKLKVHTILSGGERAVMEVPYRKTEPQKYYDNIADHLCDRKPLMVSAASAAMIINIFNTAERSSARGGLPLPLAR